MDREYRYRQIVPMTHEQYLDEPWDVIEWTLHIHDVREEIARKNQKGDGSGADAGSA